ncbi:type IX secretion system membrane protein PorP/SprF [Bacteroidota bacterium]
MKRLKIIIFIALCTVFIKQINAQQAPYYTQYMFNDYLINPAVAGTFNYIQIRANSRTQWIGMIDAPRTMSIAGYGPFKERDMGYGGYIYNDVTGPESRMSLGGTYAYNISLSDEWRISGGLNIGIMQYKLDYTKMEIDDEIYDPVMATGVESRVIPDASVGFYAWTSYYYVGISAHQLFGNNYSVHEEIDSAQGFSRLTQHIYLSGGASFILNKDFAITPSALIKYTSSSRFQAEINARVTYQRMVWAGLTYRTGHAIAVMAGYNYDNKIYIGLAYDYSLTDISKYTKHGSTIEVMIGYRFNSIK